MKDSLDRAEIQKENGDHRILNLDVLKTECSKTFDNFSLSNEDKGCSRVEIRAGMNSLVDNMEDQGEDSVLPVSVNDFFIETLDRVDFGLLKFDEI